MRRRDGYRKVQGEVHLYAGYKNQQEPRQIDMFGRIYTVTGILSRERIEDMNSGNIREVFLCRIDHRTVEVQVHADGTSQIFVRGRWREGL